MEKLLEQVRATSPWELAAAVIALAYLLLAVRRNLLCWLCAFVSTAIYLVLFARTALPMQSVLQVFYLAMAIYGFIEWRRGRSAEDGVLIRSWTVQQHLLAIAVVLAVSAVNGWWLARTSEAAAPYVDSFVTWGSVLTTFMVTRRLIENWLYWVVVDSVAAALYYSQGLLVTALLFVIYVGIVIRGYLTWRREQAAQRARGVDAAAVDHVAG